MAITYHAGRRIQGLERTGSTATYESDFSTNTGWVEADSTNTGVDTSTERLDFSIVRSTTNGKAYYDLGSALSDTEWVIRFKLVMTAKSYTSGSGIIGFFGMSSVTGDALTTQDFLGLRKHILDADGSSVTNDTNLGDGIGSSLGNPTSGTQYHELRRTSATEFINTVWGSSSYSGTPIATHTLTIASGITGLRYFMIGNYNSGSGSGTMTGYIDDLEIYDGVTSVVASTGDVKPTNVQAGSRFEETDTRKMYHYNEKVPKFNYKFDESTGDVINYGSGTNGNLTVTGLTRNVSGTPSGLGNGMNGNGSGQWATSNDTYKSDWKFLHDESKWSMTFWLKVLALPPNNDEHYVLSNTWTDNAGIGFFVRVTGVGSSTTAKLSCGVTNGTTMACNLNSSDGMIPNLTGWHFYCITLDPTLGSNNMKISCDTSETGVKYAEGTETGNSYSSSNPTYKTTFLARNDTNSNEKELNADISQVTFWEDKILTQDEKEAIYASGNGTTSMPMEWSEEGT
jgi:hypothetical protein